jgi:hypothetical protein
MFEGLTHGMYVLKDATALLSINGQGDGRTYLTWGMKDGSKVTTMVYKPYPRKVDMDQGRNVLVALWQRLDDKINYIRDPQNVIVELQDYEKAQANCLADTLALIMPTYYADSRAVLVESMKRWEARQAGVEHESPGLAESIWNPNTRADGTPWSRENEAKVRSGGAVRAPVQLDDQKIAFVKHSLANGVIAADKLAEMFNCSIEDIQRANDS